MPQLRPDLDLVGSRWISGEMWDFVLGWLVPGWVEISFNSIENVENVSTPDSDNAGFPPFWFATPEISSRSIENVENASTPDSDRERLISPLRVRHNGDKL